MDVTILFLVFVAGLVIGVPVAVTLTNRMGAINIIDAAIFFKVGIISTKSHSSAHIAVFIT